MKTAVYAAAPPLVRTRDLVELTKPRIGVMVLFTVAAGFYLARPDSVDVAALAHVLIGTALIAFGASALNQLLERRTDALMQRTENRPLPAGRMQPVEVLILGLTLSVGGLAYLALTLHQPLTLAVAAFTLVGYVLVYTPLKRWTTLNTLIGAVPGALPPVIGWTAATGRLDAEAFVLFVIVFLWQVPHFLAIAWLYREDYARAGLRMLPVVDEVGAMTARQMAIYCLALLPVGLLPVMAGQAHWVYAAVSLISGVFFLLAALGFLRQRTKARARRVLHASLIYLPTVLGLLVIESFLVR